MNTMFKMFITAIVSVLAPLFIFNACDVISDNDFKEEETLIRKTLTVRSDSKNQIQSEHDVTQRMAELFIAAHKDFPSVVRVEPYSIDGITCFYIFNYEKGFKIVSADSRVQPILAESSEENLYPDEMDNNGVRVWLEDTADRIRVLKANDIETKKDYSDFWSSFIDDSSVIQTRSLDPNQDSVWIKTVDVSSNPYSINAHVLPLTTTMWGQGSPWNQKMPTIGNAHCLTGCVAVAISQVLYYFHVKDGYPNDLWHTISIQSQNYCTDPYHSGLLVTLNKSNHVNNSSRWINMPLVPLGSNSSYVSDLMLDIGERVNMHYGINESSVYPNSDWSLPNITNCGISNSFGSYSFANVENNLINAKPVIVVAWLTPNHQGGHAWVIDGCEDYVLRTVETVTYRYVAVEDIINYNSVVARYSNDDMLYINPYAYDGMQEVNTYYDDIKQLRMNWGHDGIGNSGYYGVLDSSDWIDPYNSLNFKFSRVIHYNISTSSLN